MDDDLNTSVALAVVHNLTREVNTALARKQVKEENQRELLEVIDRIDTVLNIFGEREREMLDSEVQTSDRRTAGSASPARLRSRRRNSRRTRRPRHHLSKTPKTVFAGSEVKPYTDYTDGFSTCVICVICSRPQLLREE